MGLCLYQEDPDLKPMFEEMQQGGMEAMMKYMNNPKWLAKVGEKLGDVDMSGGAAPAQATPRPAPQPQEINDILEAAK